MVNEILQKSKRVYKGNAVLFSLYLSVCIMLVLSVNLLPLVYQKSVDFFAGNGLWKCPGFRAVPMPTITS